MKSSCSPRTTQMMLGFSSCCNPFIHLDPLPSHAFFFDQFSNYLRFFGEIYKVNDQVFFLSLTIISQGIGNWVESQLKVGWTTRKLNPAIYLWKIKSWLMTFFILDKLNVG
jgi:hypothetical protein